MKHLVAALIVASSVSGCSSSPAAPTPAPPSPTFTLSGNVSVPGVGGIASAKVTVVGGPDAGRFTTTNSTGDYELAGLTAANVYLSAQAATYEEARAGVLLNAASTLNFTLSIPIRPTSPWGPGFLWVMVLGPGGACIEGATIQVIRAGAVREPVRQSTPCDAWGDSGGLNLTDLPDVEVALRGAAIGYVPRETTFVPSRGGGGYTAVFIELQPAR